MTTILEGLITTLDEGGTVHVTPMGPEVDGLPETLVLKPFPGRTHDNLARTGQAVFHVGDAMRLFVAGTLGRVPPDEPTLPAETVAGRVLASCCRYYELTVIDRDRGTPRERFVCRVTRTGTLREFFGFSRAKHAILEACILASRRHMIPAGTLADEIGRLAPLVDKAGSAADVAAWTELLAALDLDPPTL